MRTYPVVFLLLLILLCEVHQTFAATSLLDESKGLSHTFVKDITVDKRGLMWVATYSGLNTYDGYIIREIPVFKTIQVRCIRYDEYNDRLWVGTDRGLWYINALTEELISCTPFLKQNVVTNIALNKGTAYIGFLHGSVLRISPDLSCRFMVFIPQFNEKTKLEEQNMGVDGAGTLYVHYTGTNDISLRKNHAKEKRNLFIAGINNFCIQGNELVVNTVNGVFGFDTQSETWKKSRILDSLNHIQTHPQYAVFGSDGTLFISYRNGLCYRISKGMNQVNSLPDKEILQFRTINCLYEDPYGILWLGTNKGLIKITGSQSDTFGKMLNGFASPLSIRQIIGIPDGDLFIATYSGIFRIPRGEKKIMLPIIENAFPTQSRTLLYDSNYIYIGSESEDNFFFRYDLKHSRYEKLSYRLRNKDERMSAAYSSLKDKHGVFWLATNKGLATYHPATREMILHQNDVYTTGTGSLKFIGASQDSQKIWAGGEQGVWLIDIDKGVQQELNNKTLPGFPENEIIFVNESPDGKLWCGTKGAGLVIIDRDLKHIQTLNRSNGLSNNEVYGVLWQNADTAWISTMNGLCCYAVKSNTFTNYFMENGLTDNEFNQNSFYKHRDGRFYFGGMNGITFFDPAKLSYTSPPVYIFSSAVSKWDSRIAAFTDISYKDHQTIRVRPADHLLSFSFGISDKSQPDYNSYFYRIKGLYNDWIALGNQNTLRLEGLPAGTFTVQVIAYNKRGTRTANTLEYPIHIIQVFYKTWWFFGLVVLCISGTILLYFRWRIRQLNKMQQLRTHIASNLHDEIGSLLTRITMAAENLQLRPHQVEDKAGTLEKITVLSRMVNSNMSDVLWAIDARNDFAGSFSARMRELAETVFETKEISFSIDSDEKGEFQKIPPDERQQLFLIYKEAIHNILKHSNAGNVSISFRYHNGLFMKISNDGASGAMNHGGQGLKNMEMRAAKIGAFFRYEYSGDTFNIEVSDKPLH